MKKLFKVFVELTDLWFLTVVGKGSHTKKITIESVIMIIPDRGGGVIKVP